MARVLVTREAEAADRTGITLGQAGHTPLLWPIFKVVDTGAKLPNGQHHALAFTSTNAIRILEARGWKPLHEGMKAWCVGKRTAEAAKQLGLAPIISERGNAEGMAEELAGQAESGKILYPTTQDRSFDLKAALKDCPATLEQVEIYQIQPMEFDIETVRENLVENKPDIVFTYSSRSSQHLFKLINSANISREMKSTELIAISDNAAAPLGEIPWKTVKIANHPEEAAMIDIIS